MSGLRVRVDRLDINVHGLSAQVVQEATEGLERMLRRSLQAITVGRGSALDLGELSVGPVTVPQHVDAGALRAFLVEQVETALRQALPDEEQGEES